MSPTSQQLGSAVAHFVGGWLIIFAMAALSWHWFGWITVIIGGLTLMCLVGLGLTSSIRNSGMRPLDALHPIARARLKRRVKYGVTEGTPAEQVAAALGDPTTKYPGEYPNDEVWAYDLGSNKTTRYEYSVIIDRSKGVVTASWWGSKRIC